jgi:hypothetical protein
MTSSVTSSVSWARRAGVSVLGVVFLSAVAPALANAAGAHVRNPVAIALRALATSEPEPCVTPTATGEEPTVEPTVEATAEPTASASAAAEPTTEPSATEAPDCDEESAVPTSPAPTSAAPESEAPESPEAAEPGDAAAHGRLVSTVAHCAPHGKDPLLAVEGAPANHGAYVTAAAHGDSLTTPWGTFDLSGQAGADALCAALDAARAALPPAAPKAAHAKHAGKAHAAKAHHGKPAKAAKHDAHHGG